MKQILKLTLIFFGLVNLLFVTSAAARVLSGQIEKSAGKYYIKKKTVKVEVKILDSNILKVFERLSENDFISVDSLIQPSLSTNPSQTKLALVKSINYVGLTNLLGYWTDQNGLCYHFLSYTKINVFIPTQKISCRPIPTNIETDPVVVTNYNYFINPDDASGWDMLVSNDKKQYLVELKFIDPQSYGLVVYNSVDGKKLSELKISKLKKP